MADSNFSGKVALVTGGTSGIGRATALAYAEQGARVVVAGRRASEGEEVVSQIRKAGGEAIFVKTDVSQEAEVEQLIKTTVATYGQLDFAFNNAGTEGKFGALTELAEKDWDVTIDTNLKGVWLSMKYEIAQMARQGSGVIVNNSSNLGHVGMAQGAAYVASKHGVIGLTKTAALEYAKAGIRINSVSPGPIQTDMPTRAFGSVDNFKGFITPSVPLGRIGQPEEIASAVVWLSSPGAAFVIGQDILVDGGITAQ